jgi:hypothetical protein
MILKIFLSKSWRNNGVYTQGTSLIWGQCYDFKDILIRKVGEIMAFFAQDTLCKKLENIGF